MEIARVFVIFNLNDESAQAIVVFLALAVIAVPICLALDWMRRDR
jgi:hypothetical protein